VTLIKNYFVQQTEVIEARVYGSRAMGRQKHGSDIDLAIFTTVGEDISGRIISGLEDLPTPYMFDGYIGQKYGLYNPLYATDCNSSTSPTMLIASHCSFSG